MEEALGKTSEFCTLGERKNLEKDLHFYTLGEKFLKQYYLQCEVYKFILNVITIVIEKGI